MTAINYTKEAKLAAIVTAVIAVPVFFIAGYFSNFEVGPGIEFLFWLGVFLLLPVYLFKDAGLLVGVVGWAAILIIEPLWLFGLVLLSRLGWLTVRKRCITVPSSGREKASRR